MGNAGVIMEREIEDAMLKVKYRKLSIIKGNKTYHYICNTAIWNYWLGRFYPNAELIQIDEHFK